MKRVILLCAAALGAALLAGCGLKGDLSTPAPLWGDRSRQVVERDLPSQSGDDTQIVFTRDDVDLFNDDEVEEDPFAEDEEEPLPLGPQSDRSVGGE